VGECASGDVRLFNPTAAYIWQRLSERLSESRIAEALARDFGVERSIAHRDVAAMLDAWRIAGLATFGETTHAAREPVREVAAALVDADLRTYRIGDKPFAVRFRIEAGAHVDERRFLERVMALLAPLEGECDEPCPEVELRVDSSYGTAYGPFCREIVQRLFGPFEWLFTLHAAAIARGPGAIALCAPQGGGKSTLAAYAAARGWRFFNDDLTIVDPLHASVLPLPVAIGVKEGSRTLLEGDYPWLRTAPEHRYGDKAARYVGLADSAAASEPAPLAAIVFCRYEHGAATEMARLEPSVAAQRLLQAGIVFSSALRPEMIEWTASLLRSTPCHHLRYSSLAEAETALRTIS
jgi:hypothetical protein